MTIDYSHVDRLQAEDKDLLIRKNTAYGNDNLVTAGLPGIATRLLDKASRLATLLKNPTVDVGDESIRDTLRDVSNYGTLGRMLIDGQLNDYPNTVYLAGPLDFAPEEIQVGWRNLAGNVLAQYKVAPITPNFVPCKTDEARRQVMEICYRTVGVVDMMLAYLPYDVPTLGVIREIEFARHLGQRVVVASPWAGKSVFSADLEVFPSVPLALCHILKLQEDEYNELVTVIFGPPRSAADWDMFTSQEQAELIAEAFKQDEYHESGDSPRQQDTRHSEEKRSHNGQDEQPRGVGHTRVHAGRKTRDFPGD